jgi:hypothetical protein
MCCVSAVAQVHPLRPHFVTGEADIVIRSKAPAKGTERLREPKKPETRLVHFWDFSKRVPLPGSPMRFQRHIYCAAFSGDGTNICMCVLFFLATLFLHCGAWRHLLSGTFLALGHDDGWVSVLEYDTMTVVAARQVCQPDCMVSCLAWTPAAHSA